MKVKCPYCDSMINDTLEQCPNCGAPNSGVRRKSGKQPITIEELKNWYAERGLPPYETTRFFIGIDYKRPRAFGIYQDPQTGNFVVYKNKANGQRAIRYEGTDEAYAVNELYQRLKQEIIEQKRANLKKRSQHTARTVKPARKPQKARRRFRFAYVGIIVTAIVALQFFLSTLVVFIAADPPKDGYYRYEQTVYYHYDHSEPENHTDWFWYDKETRNWNGPIHTDDLPQSLRENKQAQDYFLSENTPKDIIGHSFRNSDAYQDAQRGYTVASGYYQYDDRTYYHLYSSYDYGWYYYDAILGDWYATSYEDIPNELYRNSSAEDFYYTPIWDSSTQLKDFTDTSYYQNYQDNLNSLYSDDNDDDDDWDNDWDDNDYDWDSNDSWDNDYTDWDSDW